MFRHLYQLVQNLFRKERADRDLDEEIRAYIELTAADKVRSGMPPGEALRDTRRDLGSLDQVKESVRDVRTGVFLDALAQDVRYAVRSLMRSPGFAAVVVLTLALGIGANSVISSVVNAVLLKPLPYRQPDRLVMLWERSLADGSLGTASPANFYDWREQSRSFERMAAIDPYPDFILQISGEARRLAGAAVTSDFFSLLGVRMALGRDFSRGEDRPGRNQVVILSDSAWQHYFGGRSGIIGQPLTLNNASYLVIGVLPRGFALVSRASDLQSRNRFDVWTPLALSSPPEAWQRGTHPLSVLGRLQPGIALQQAQADLDHIAANLQRLYPADDKQSGITAVPMGQYVVAHVRTALLTLLGAVGMVLLIACANIANLLLSRGAARRKEMALRTALGAGRRRIAQQLVTESLVIALIGAGLGLACAWSGVPALVRHLPAGLPRSAEITVDWRVLAFTSLVALLTGIVFGLVPLFQFRQVNANESLKQSGRAVAGGQSQLQGALIVGQVAMALVLLTGAGLMTKSLWRLAQVAPGFQVEHILTARLSLPPQYTNNYRFGTGLHRRISAFQRDVLERVRVLPGVRSAAFASYLPLSGADNSWAFDIEGRPAKPPGVYDLMNYRPVTAGYFKTIGIPVQRGRPFGARDTEDGPLVVIVNESLARAFFSGQNPIGQRVRFGDAQWRTVVGVAGDVHHHGLGSKAAPEMYVPYGQVPNVEARPIIVLRTSIEPASATSALRKAVADVDAGVPMDEVETMRQIVSGSVAESRFRTVLLVLFALLALFVASIGLYGVMSYVVGQRIREFGIRMALGASRGAVLRHVMGQAGRLAGIGIGLGLGIAAICGRLIASLLFGVAPFDIVTVAGVSLLLILVAMAASYIPAHRAASADPVDSLRYE